MREALAPTSESKCLHLPSVASAGLAPVMAERPVSECKSSKSAKSTFRHAEPIGMNRRWAFRVLVYFQFKASQWATPSSSLPAITAVARAFSACAALATA